MQAVILAGGPSLTQQQVDHCRGKACVVAINESWRLAPWADVLYGCDWQWWAYRAPSPAEFPGACVAGTWASQAMHGTRAKYLDRVEKVSVAPATYELLDPPGPLGAGGNSAFQAAGLLVRWGFTRILLLGVDCHSPGQHWHGAHDYPHAITAHSGTVARWLKAWNNAAPQFAERGVVVLNCSPGSAVHCYSRMTIEEALP